ncbi:hypothetical protein PT974_03127 [Cladobotryum mycophilum]|uniref:Uncharacterized protein n=1 Tax=Cladobotryum mycophilum TaxID=491253 RepID=A0ABR0SRS8_9HYPO
MKLGALMMHVPPQICGANPSQDEHLFFEESKRLDYSNVTLKEQQTACFTYSCPLEFRFPAKSHCHDCNGTHQLPSSLEILENRSRVTVHYTLTVAVHQMDSKIISWLSRSKKIKRELAFSSDRPLILCLPPFNVMALPLPRREQNGDVLDLPDEDIYPPPYSKFPII